MPVIIQFTLQVIAVSFILAIIFVPFIKKLSFLVRAIDIPNKRKIHQKPIPRLGGLAIYLVFLTGFMIFGTPSAIMNSVLIASFLIVLVGIIDDIKPLDAKTKITVQFMAALVLVFYGELLIDFIEAFGIYFEFGIFAYPLTIFFILGCINCLNFIDGLDGLAAGVSSIYFTTIIIVPLIIGMNGVDYLITAIMLGATLGFLLYNFNPASIFMGDTGSTFLGLIIAVITLLGFKAVTLTSLFIPLMLLAIPILDTIFAILRRLLKKEKISNPDKLHIHHQLLNKNLSQRAVVLNIYAVNSLFSLAIILYILDYTTFSYVLYGLLLVLITVFIVKTEILIPSKK